MAAIQNNDAYIGQLLVNEGVINQDDLIRGLEEQIKRHDYLCSTLVRMGFASEERIFSILSLQIGVPFLNLKEAQLDLSALRRMPGKLARAFKCLVLRVVDDVAYLAMSDPLNAQSVQEIRAYLGVSKVKIFLAGDQDISSVLEKHCDDTL